MSEQLIIRLASEANQTIHWLIWSEKEQEIIASGELDNAEALTLLTEKAQTRKVICLAPSVDITLKSVTIKGGFTRQMQQALPYMLEDELASDVDKLHFSVLSKKVDQIEVAICFKTKLQLWLDWLEAAEIFCQRMIPEALALPTADETQWQALQQGKQWLIREGDFQAWSCEDEMLGDVLALRLQQNTQQVIQSYSPLPDIPVGQWIAATPVLPMQLLTEGSIHNSLNLLTGEFAIQKESHLQLHKWKGVAMAAGILFVVLVINLFVKIEQTEKQISIVKSQVEDVYQEAFPDQGRLRYSRIKKRLKTLLASTDVDKEETGLLIILNELLPALKAVPSIEISNLKYVSRNQELSLTISADSFEAFEQFAAKVPTRYAFEQGTLGNSADRIAGTVTVRVK
ncbi:type II secretion system protein GspL [Psychromonas sp. 14N.309.X.WAT.B.A12]|uniref:type II secretion system protein GspL n=1 Tax=Psychromonas sp. 14N.309.X.WAT.B.A12 TaxID=2998322 RepID=UPI0025AECE5C|nr:type II secretion system protein GspL [Psychromonas sp. 14N.309.X.WAT.B.A12]MDN2664452.1 type II secretion system protein GspL [Psychromonas sp. 14N.309.X.WAT.B.A12]